VKQRKLEQDQEKRFAARHNKQMEEIRNRHVSNLDMEIMYHVCALTHLAGSNAGLVYSES